MKKIVKIAVLTFAAAMLLLTTACSEAAGEKMMEVLSGTDGNLFAANTAIESDDATIRAAILQEINVWRAVNNLEPLVENEGWLEYMEMLTALFEKSNTDKIVWDHTAWTAGYAKSAELRMNSIFAKEFGYLMYEENDGNKGDLDIILGDKESSGESSNASGNYANYDPDKTQTVLKLMMEYTPETDIVAQLRADKDACTALMNRNASQVAISIVRVGGKVYWMGATVGY